MNVEVAVFRTTPKIVVETIDPTDPDNRWGRTWELFEFPLEYLTTAGLGVQWSERPRASFTVSPEDFVSDVLAQAAESLRVSWTAAADEFFGELGGFAYRQRDLRFALDPHGTVPLLAMVDELGRATFNVFPDDIRFADVARARVAGLYEGDPQRLALIIDPFPGVEAAGATDSRFGRMSWTCTRTCGHGWKAACSFRVLLQPCGVVTRGSRSLFAATLPVLSADPRG